MRKSLLLSMLLAALVGALSVSMEAASNGVVEAFGFSSDDSAGGSSYLGVDTRDITQDQLAALHLKDLEGVEVTMVDQDAPAGKAGIKEQDVIISINGEKVESVEQLRRMIHEIPPGRTITIGLSRNGQPLTVKAELSRRNQAFAFGPSSEEMQKLRAQADNLNSESKEIRVQIPPIPDFADMDLPVSVVVVHSALRSGLLVENLTPQLGDYFGAKGGHGVLVRSVEKGSLAEKAGFRAGDVVVRVNDEFVNDASDFGHALRSRKDNTVKIGVLRDKKEQTLTLTLPPRDQSDLFQESFQLPQIGADLGRLKLRLATFQHRLAERGWL
jgi:serine protease Do